MHSGLYHFAIMALTLADRGKNCSLKVYFYSFIEHFLYIYLWNHRSTVTCKRIFQTSARKPRNQCKHQQLCYFPISRPILLRRLSEKCITEGSQYAHWIGLYLSLHLSWVLGPFIHGRLQNLKTSEDTFGHDITPLTTGSPLAANFVNLGVEPQSGRRRFFSIK